MKLSAGLYMGAKRIFGRLILSLVGGAALFISLSAITGVLSLYTENRTARMLLELPSRWPRYLYFYLSPASSKPSLYFSDTASLVVLIVCDILLYAGFTFLALWALSTFRRREVKYDAPPPPGHTK